VEAVARLTEFVLGQFFTAGCQRGAPPVRRHRRPPCPRPTSCRFVASS